MRPSLTSAATTVEEIGFDREASWNMSPHRHCSASLLRARRSHRDRRLHRCRRCRSTAQARPRSQSVARRLPLVSAQRRARFACCRLSIGGGRDDGSGTRKAHAHKQNAICHCDPPRPRFYTLAPAPNPEKILIGNSLNGLVHGFLNRSDWAKALSRSVRRGASRCPNKFTSPC
jgi:hypothetical protein